MKIWHILCVGALLTGGVSASELVGSAFVNVTSDTAATAKNMAFDEARRQIVVETLSPYSDSSALRAAVAAEKSSMLTPLIASSGISGEKLSDTTYSAKITMTVNKVAAKRWLNEHNVQNWVNTEESVNETFPMIVMLNNKVDDWARVRRIAMTAGINLNATAIGDGQIMFNVATRQRGAITMALRDAGWKYKDRDGALYIFK